MYKSFILNVGRQSARVPFMAIQPHAVGLPSQWWLALLGTGQTAHASVGPLPTADVVRGSKGDTIAVDDAMLDRAQHPMRDLIRHRQEAMT